MGGFDMRIKNIVFLLLAASLIVMLAACSDDDETDAGGSEEALDNLNEEGLPIVDEEIDLEIFAGKAATTADDWNDVLLSNEYEEMTNMNITWNQVAADGLDEKRNLALASGDLPDAFYAANIPVSDIQKYGDQGTFIPLRSEERRVGTACTSGWS